MDSHLLGLWGGDNLSSNEEVLWSRLGPSIHSRSTLLTHSSRSKGLRSHGTNQKELATGPTHHGSIGLLSEHDQITRSAQASSEDPDVLSDHTA